MTRLFVNIPFSQKSVTQFCNLHEIYPFKGHNNCQLLFTSIRTLSVLAIDAQSYCLFVFFNQAPPFNFFSQTRCVQARCYLYCIQRVPSSNCNKNNRTTKKYQTSTYTKKLCLGQRERHFPSVAGARVAFTRSLRNSNHFCLLLCFKHKLLYLQVSASHQQRIFN